MLIPVDRSPRRWAVFAVVAVALLTVSIDQTAVAAAMTSMGRDLGTTIAWAGWTITIYSVGQVLALPLAGVLCARYGPRRVFLCSVAVLVAATLCSALAPNIAVLIAFRLCQGMAGGMMLPAESAVVAHEFGPDRDRALGLFATVFPVGAILGPLVGGVVTTVWSWRMIFVVTLPVGLLLLVLGAWLVPSPPTEPPGRFDLRGMALLFTLLLSFMVTVTRLSSPAPGAMEIAAGVVVAVGSATVLLRHCRRHPDPVIPVRLLATPGLGAINIANVLYGAAALGFAALVPNFAEQRYSIAPLAAGVLLTARAAGMISTSGAAVAVLRRTGHRPLVLGGFAAITLGLGLTAAPPPPAVSPTAWLLLTSAVCGLGLGVSTPAANNAGLHLVPDAIAAVSGLRMLFRQTGAIASVSVITAVATASTDPGAATAWGFAALAVLMAGGALVVARVPNQRGSW